MCYAPSKHNIEIVTRYRWSIKETKNGNDKLIIGGHEFNSRFILGSGKYSLDLIKAAVENAGAEIITLALRRAQLVM